MARSVLLVQSNPVSPERDAEYNDWYDNVHLADLLRIKGIVAATRYRLCDITLLPDVPLPQHRYLAVYEVEGETAEELQAVCENLILALLEGEMVMSESIDIADLAGAFYLPITKRHEASAASHQG